VFKTKLCIGPIEYLIQVKMKKATELLLYIDAAFQDIAKVLDG